MINHNLNRHKKITRQRTRRNTRRHMKGGWTPKKTVIHINDIKENNLVLVQEKVS
jgi:hypothetical protein